MGFIKTKVRCRVAAHTRQPQPHSCSPSPSTVVQLMIFVESFFQSQNIYLFIAVLRSLMESKYFVFLYTKLWRKSSWKMEKKIDFSEPPKIEKHIRGTLISRSHPKLQLPPLVLTTKLVSFSPASSASFFVSLPLASSSIRHWSFRFSIINYALGSSGEATILWNKFVWATLNFGGPTRRFS